MHVKLTMFNWNDLESFIILSRSGKLNQAAKKLKIEPTTISRRILRLEEKGREIYQFLLDVASGQQSKSEAQGLGDYEFVPWQIGATM